MIKGEYIQDYFTRVSQFKEKLSVIGDTLDDDELVMNFLNGLTRLGTHSSKPYVPEKKL